MMLIQGLLMLSQCWRGELKSTKRDGKDNSEIFVLLFHLIMKTFSDYDHG